MTEDDTFRVLTQHPYKMVKELARLHILNMETEEEAREFFLKHGWTFEEFEKRLLDEDLS